MFALPRYLALAGVVALGIGCGVCGSLVLGAAAPFTGALAALPLAGGEFGIASVVLLSLRRCFGSELFLARQTCTHCACSFVAFQSLLPM